MCGRLGLPTLQVQKDEFMSNNWVLALLWCSSASGEESPLWKGCFVMYHVEILMGLERGMSWSTSGPVRRSFPNERWKGWFPTRVSLSLIYLLSKTCLWFPFLALVDNSEFKWLLRPLWASCACPWADLTTQLQYMQQRKPLAFFIMS